MPSPSTTPLASVRALGATGAALLVLGQALTLVHLRPLSDYWYGIVWTGFILAADAALTLRTGAGLLLDRRRDFLAMLLLSAGLWWLFEGANALFLHSWGYSPSPDVPRWLQALRSTFFFATLLPATWEATLLALSFARPRPVRSSPPKHLALGALVAGAAVAVSLVWLPALALPLALISLGLVLDGVNLMRRRPSLLALLASRAPLVPLCVAGGNIAAGFLGEMWNYPADPSWTYHAPYAPWLPVFRMPLLGYLGYGALALDLFALYHFLRPTWRPGPPLPADHPLSLTGLD